MIIWNKCSGPGGGTRHLHHTMPGSLLAQGRRLRSEGKLWRQNDSKGGYAGVLWGWIRIDTYNKEIVFCSAWYCWPQGNRSKHLNANDNKERFAPTLAVA